MDHHKTRRIAALLIDLIIIGILMIILENVLPEFFRFTDIKISNWSLKVRPNLGYLLYLPYFLVFDVLSDGTSIGKQVFGLVVRPENGTFLSFQVKLSRTLLKMISITFLPISAVVFLLFKGYNLQDALTPTTVVLKNE